MDSPPSSSDSLNNGNGANDLRDRKFSDGPRSWRNADSEKFVITVTDLTFQKKEKHRSSEQGVEENRSKHHRVYTRTREYGTLKSCLECIQQSVQPCGVRYIRTTEFGQSEFETAQVEVHRGGELVVSSQHTDLWAVQVDDLLETLLGTAAVPPPAAAGGCGSGVAAAAVTAAS
mmetsp:Transcript_12697/g.21465  ORF Transcript_12697/g.21465 Transcript_12697/m.21465 type:complete len:174 (-) Transcript_12697:28-549(-)